jgi:hypothetical protein
MQKSHHNSYTVEKSVPRFPVDESIIVACPSSTVLEGIERYFKTIGNTVDLHIPVRDVSPSQKIALEQRVDVAYEAHGNPSFVARYDDRLELDLRMPGSQQPNFIGRLTVLPENSESHLRIEGMYEPPNDDQNADADTAHAMAHSLLEVLKTILETEFQTVTHLLQERAQPPRHPRSRLQWLLALRTFKRGKFSIHEASRRFESALFWTTVDRRWPRPQPARQPEVVSRANCATATRAMPGVVFVVPSTQSNIRFARR